MGPSAKPARQALLDAATETLVTGELDAVSLDPARRRAGVGNGSIDHHFATTSRLARGVSRALREYPRA